VGRRPAAIQERIETLRKEANFILAKKPGDGSPSGNKHDFEELEDRITFAGWAAGVFSVRRTG